ARITSTPDNRPRPSAGSSGPGCCAAAAAEAGDAPGASAGVGSSLSRVMAMNPPGLAGDRVVGAGEAVTGAAVVEEHQAVLLAAVVARRHEPRRERHGRVVRRPQLLGGDAYAVDGQVGGDVEHLAQEEHGVARRQPVEAGGAAEVGLRQLEALERSRVAGGLLVVADVT